MYRNRAVKNCRKPYYCIGCGRRYPAGSPKHDVTAASSYDFYSYSLCPLCNSFIDDRFLFDCISDSYGEFEDGSVYEFLKSLRHQSAFIRERVQTWWVSNKKLYLKRYKPIEKRQEAKTDDQ